MFRYVDISSVDNQRKSIVEAKTIVGKEAPSRARQMIRANDVLVATTRPNLNAVAIVPPELDGSICSTGFCVLRSNGQVVQEYLFAFVRTGQFIRSLSDLVHRFIKTFTYQEANRSNFFQRCTTGAALISAIPRKILSLSSALDFTRICLKNVCAILPKSVSTKLSHEPCLGVCT